MMLTDAETMSGVTGYAAITKWLGNNFAVNSALVKNNEAATTASFYSYTEAEPGYWNAKYGFQNDGEDDFEDSADIIAFFFFDNGTDEAYNVMGDDGEYSYSFNDTYVGSATAWNSPYTSGWQAVNVPEPTSGLLMLLGMAGLALKRRRA